MKFYIFFIIGIVSLCNGKKYGSDVFQDIYNTCLSKYSLKCVKPKALAWISDVVSSDEIKLTNDLSIIKTGTDEEPIDFNKQGRGNAYIELFDKIDSFISTHGIKMKFPAFLNTPEARSMIDGENVEDLKKDIELPLSDGNVAEGKLFIQKFAKTLL